MTAVVRQRAKKQPAEIRREEVLDAAVRVFARESFRGAGTAEIAREAGIAEPTIYRHFESKRDLYLCALDRSCSVVRAAFRGIAESNDDALTTIIEMVRWYGQSIEQDPDYLRLRMRAGSETNDDEVREQLARAYQELIGLVSDVVRKGQEQGVFKKHVPVQGAAWMFMAVGQIADLTKLLGMEGSETAQRFADMGTLFWEMLIEPARLAELMPALQATLASMHNSGR